MARRAAACWRRGASCAAIPGMTGGYDPVPPAHPIPPPNAGRHTDGPEAAVPGDRGFARDPAGLSVPDAAPAAAGDRRRSRGGARRDARAGAPAGAPPVPAAGQAASRAAAVPQNVPRVKIDGAAASPAAISLLGARHRRRGAAATTTRPSTKIQPAGARCWSRAPTPQPYYVQFGWTAPPGSDRQAARTTTRCGPRLGGEVTPGKPATLTLGQRRGPDLPNRHRRSTTTTCSRCSSA